MQSKVRLPSLRAVEIFVAAGRALSFAAGAQAVSLTPSAVSRRIRDLEHELGTPLFYRFNRRVELTPAGARFLGAAGRAIDLIEHEAAALRPQRDGRTLRLSVLQSLASTWLLPRLATFRQRRPDIEVRIETSSEMADLVGGAFDAAIRFGDGRWPGLSSVRLFETRGFAVASPAHWPCGEPRIIPAIYVKPFMKGQKNDYNDAEAIAEAALRPNLRVVKEKTQDQLDLQACHRVRSRLVSRRTATINQIRAFLIEQGIAVRAGPRALRNSLFAILENRKDEISPRMTSLILGLYDDWCQLDERIETVTSEIEKLSQIEATCRQLMSVPGIGPVISTGIVAAIGTGEAFERGRDFGAWLGLVPRQHSTGGRSILGRISKRGSKYLRTLLIQAAKVLLMRPHNWPRFSFGGWLKTASERLHRNKLAVALANKLARIAWSVLRHGKAFDTHLEAVAI